MDDRDCLENSCTLRGTVGSNPTLSVNDPDLRYCRVRRLLDRAPDPSRCFKLASHLQQHRQRKDEGVFRNLDIDRLAKVGQQSVHFKLN